MCVCWFVLSGFECVSVYACLCMYVCVCMCPN